MIRSVICEREDVQVHIMNLDPIFYLPQYGCTTAQLEPDVKNELSHRGKALRAIKEQLRKYCEEGAYEDTDRQ